MATRESTQLPNPVQFLEQYFRGKRLSPEFGLRVSVNPARFVEQAYFRIHPSDERGGNLSADPVFAGLFSAGRRSQRIHGWVDGDYHDLALLSDGTSFSMSEASLDVELFRLLGGLVPVGGSLMVSYSLFSNESKIHKETRLGLDRGYPPVATPLGFLLFAGGCGMGFKDWYFAEGGQEGPEKLQGYKPINSEVARQKADFMLQELRVFASRTPYDDLAYACRSKVERLISELEHMGRNS